MGSNPYRLLYGIEVGGWRDVEDLVKVTRVTQGQMAYHCCMDLKLGGWSHLLAPNILKVIGGQKVYHCCMDMKLGGWSHLWMLTILNVSSKTPGVIKCQMANHCCMKLKLGGWIHLLMPIVLKVSSRSPGVKVMSQHYSMDNKLLKFSKVKLLKVDVVYKLCFTKTVCPDNCMSNVSSFVSSPINPRTIESRTNPRQLAN